MTKWQDLFDNKTARVIDGTGFSVRLYSPSNLRYSEGERSVTLLTEVVDESDKLGRKWLMFPRVRVVVYLPTTLKWDDGTPVGPAAAPVVVNRILEALETAGEEHRTEVSDDVYQQALRDWEEFGPRRSKEQA